MVKSLENEIEGDSFDVVADVLCNSYSYVPENIDAMVELNKAEKANYIGRNLAEKAESLSLEDDLTGLPNRRAFDIAIGHEITRGSRGSHSAKNEKSIKYNSGLIVLDIDNFKEFNDTYGHKAGDAVLQKVADVYRNIVTRDNDVVARYGGEEFAVVLPDTSYEGTMKVAKDIVEGVAREPMTFTNESGEECEKFITISAGVANYMVKDSVDSLFGRADSRLYDAKGAGRNCAVGRS